MTLKIALLALSVPLVVAGSHGLYQASRNRTQTSLSCEQFTRQRPSAVWLRVTGCELDYIGAGYREARGRIAELYFPVRPPRTDQSAPVSLVAVTRDPQALAIAQETIGHGRDADPEAFLVMMLRIVTALRASRQVDGTIRTSPLTMLSTRRALAGMGAALAPDVAVLDLHERPAFLWPALEATTGLMALVVFLFLRQRRREVGARAHRLPAVMLLNLPENATTADIEHAPPLGNRDEVVGKLQSAIEGIKLSGTQGTLQRRNISMTVDLGDADVVWTAVVNASGRTAPEAVRALMAATGWRVFVPKRGIFAAGTQIDDLTQP